MTHLLYNDVRSRGRGSWGEFTAGKSSSNFKLWKSFRRTRPPFPEQTFFDVLYLSQSYSLPSLIPKKQLQVNGCRYILPSKIIPIPIPYPLLPSKSYPAALTILYFNNSTFLLYSSYKQMTNYKMSLKCTFSPQDGHNRYQCKISCDTSQQA